MRLLAVIEQGGYPDFNEVYKSAGFDINTVHSTRKALAFIKRQPPDIIVAEFIYSPSYGSKISNFEALTAGMQRDAPNARLIALIDPHNLTHLESLADQLPQHEVLHFPISNQQLSRAIERLCPTY